MSELTGGQRVEPEVLAALVAELRRRRAAQSADGADEAASEASAGGGAEAAPAQGDGVGAQQNGDGEPVAAPTTVPSSIMVYFPVRSARLGDRSARPGLANLLRAWFRETFHACWAAPDVDKTRHLQRHRAEDGTRSGWSEVSARR